ncbi:MAG: DUF1801 domain-containing protein [Bacteroidota bacterium]
MDTKIKPAATVDEYIKKYPKEVQVILLKLRKTIKAAAPKAEEVISYQMPAYKYKGMLVYFAAWKSHIGFYPAGSIKTFTKELSEYEVSKGTIRFPLDKPFPFGLISKIVKFRMKENEERAIAKKNSRTTTKKPSQKK